jgi:hypothetical protein
MWLSAPPGLTVPTPDFPVVGNTIPIAFFFMIHIAVAEYSAGAIAIAPAMELRAVRTGDERAMRYARSLVNSYYLVFSLGATLAVFAVVLLIGLWGREFGDLINVFLPLVGVIFGLFIVLAPMLVIYRNSFGRMQPNLHVALGFGVFVLQTLFVIGITALDAYLIIPQHAGLGGGALNPTYLPLLLHRLAGNVSWTALLLAAVAVILLRRADTEEERAFQSWAARINLRIGLLFGLVMPIFGFALIEAVRQNQVGYFNNLVNGEAAYLFVIQEVLFGALLVCCNIALALELPASGRIDALGRAAVAVTALGMVVGALPSQVLGPSIEWVRYVGIALALVVTSLHLFARTVPRGAMPRLAPAPGAAAVVPYSTSILARRSVIAAALLGFVLALFMGYIKEEARGDYSFYGELTQTQGHGRFDPGGGLYP